MQLLRTLGNSVFDLNSVMNSAFILNKTFRPLYCMLKIDSESGFQQRNTYID